MSEHDLDVAIEKCERIMEMDARTMQNPVSENGYIFEKVYELLQYLRQFQFATDTNVGDTISRQALLDAVEGVDWYHQNKNGEMVHGANSDEHQAWYKADDIYKAIESVPTAQLAQDLPNACADAISRQAAIETVRKAKDKSEAHRMLMQLPPVQPGWIPWNSGRFPEESGTYTVTAYDGATKRVTYAKYQKRLKRWELTGARAYWRVLAWMPHIKPWEGGQDGKN